MKHSERHLNISAAVTAQGLLGRQEARGDERRHGKHDGQVADDRNEESLLAGHEWRAGSRNETQRNSSARRADAGAVYRKFG